MWKSSPKPEREDEKKTSVLYIAVLGFGGLLMEAIGVWLLFSWLSTVPMNTQDPKLFVGAVLAFAGFVVLTRWLAALVKELMR